MSGGVDSAVAAYLLKEQGYDVVGVFMKNWQDDEVGCSAARDFEDVKSVCSAIGIPYYAVNFEQEYYERVFKLFLSEYERGRTPNPDVLCNSEIKFAAFLDYARKLGSAKIATGHYARSKGARLFKAADPDKDQTYFLCMLSKEQVESAVFPVGGMKKSEVRALAEKIGLSVARKKDSTGICFIGERKFREFLSGYLPAKPGEIRTRDGRVLGTHQGVMYYTIGQRRGLGIGGVKEGPEGRWYVIDKDVRNNILYVAQDEYKTLYTNLIYVSSMHYINGRPSSKPFECSAKFRYRQPDQKVLVTPREGAELIESENRQRAVTPGQYAVLYDADECLGGGVIDKVYYKEAT